MKLLKNSLYGFAGVAVPIAISLITVPLFVSAIGLERYGALAIAWLLLGYFGQADFGIGRAITQRVSSMKGESPDQLATAVSSAFASIIGFGLVGAGLIFLTASWFFGGPFDVADGLRGELLASVWVLALCNPVVAVSGVASGALMGLERFKLASTGTLIGNSLMQVLPLAYAMLVDDDLGALIAASLAGRLCGFAILAFGVWWAFFRRSAVSVSWREMKRLTRFGAWIMVSALIGPLMIFADRFVIGAIAGAVAVAAYTIPFQIASRTQVFPIAIVQALFPRFANEQAEVSLARCRDYTVFVGQIFAPVVIVLVCLCEPLLRLWLGQSLDERSILVGQVLMVGFWINAVANVPYAFIQARGNPRFTALLHLAELPVYAVLLFVLGGAFGLGGVAAAFALRCAIDCTALIARSGLAWKTAMVRLAAPILLIALALSSSTALTSLAALALAAAALAFAACVAGILQMPEAIRERLSSVPLAAPFVRLGYKP